MWNPINGGDTRRGRKIVVKEVEARLDASASTRSVLEIHQVSLNMGPFSTSQLSRMITAHYQSPSLKDISISGSTSPSEYNVTIGAGYPKLSAMAKRGETVSRPPTCIGLNLKDLQVGIANGNQFCWEYPVSKSSEYMKKSAKFVNHNGTIMYPSSSPPEAMSI